MFRSKLTSLYILTFLDHLSYNITLPALTFIFFDTDSRLFSPTTSHATRYMFYGLCLMIGHITNIISAPLLGIGSDFYGRKRFLIICAFGALTFAITTSLGIIFGMLSVVIIGRFVSGMFSTTNPIALAVVGDLETSDKKVVSMGYLQSMIELSALIGPGVGGYFAKRYFFNQFNYAIPFILAAFIAFVCVLYTDFYFKKSLAVYNKKKPMFSIFYSTIKLLKSRQVLKISIILFVSQIFIRTYLLFVPPFLKLKLDFSPVELGWFLSFFSLWALISASLLIKIVKRFLSLAKMLYYSVLCMLIGTLLTFLESFLSPGDHRKILIFLSTIPIAIGGGILYSCIVDLYSRATDCHEQGKIMGMCFLIISATWIFTSIVGSALGALGVIIPFAMVLLSNIILIILLSLPYFKLDY